MLPKLGIFLFSLIICASCNEFLTASEKMELISYVETQSEILNKITAGYRRDVAPLYTKARYSGNPIPLPINMTATYVKMLSLNELEQTISIIGEWIMAWYDFRFEWNPADYNGVEMVTTSWMKLWIPDLVPVDVVDFLQNYFSEQQVAKIYYNGTVSIMASYVFKIVCPLDVSNFPFDTQTCVVKITTGNYDVTEVSLHLNIFEDKLREGMNNGEWVATNFSTSLVNTVVPYRDRPFPVVHFHLSLRRTPTYYIVMIIIPSFILTYLSIWGLFWSEVSEETQSEKLGLGFSSVLALVLNMQTATTTIPKISEVPLLSACILANLFLVTSALMVITITSRILRCHETKNKKSKDRIVVLIKFTRRHIHRFYLLLFSIGATINLIELMNYIDAQSRILANITSGYNKDVAPLYTKASYSGNPIPLPVNMTSTYVKMLSLNELEQTISVIGEWLMFWYDFRFEWNPADYNGVEMVTINWLKIWIPDFVPVDVVDLQQNFAEMQVAKIYFNGTVSVASSYVFTIVCPLDVSNFPFDTQTCAVKITTLNYDITELSLHFFMFEDKLKEGMTNGEWVATNLTNKVEETIVPYKRRPVPAITFQLSLRRTPTYYVVMIIIPSFILTYLSIWGLFWSEVSEETQSEKLGLGFSSVLALILNMQTATTTIPKISEVPLLSASILANLLLVSSALMVITITSRCLRMFETKKKDKKSNGRIAGFLLWAKRHIHVFYFLVFSIAATINLSVLLSKK